MASQTANPPLDDKLLEEIHADSHTNTGIENKKLIMWLFLASDCMFFGTLISTHLIYRKLYPFGHPQEGAVDITGTFDIELTSFSTFILLMSSFLMALAVSAMHKGAIESFRRYTFGVILFGLIFLGGQVYEFQHFFHGQGWYEWTATNAAGEEVSGTEANEGVFHDVADTAAAKANFLHEHHGYELTEFKELKKVPGLSLQNSVFGSTFYVMTGTHGTHVAIGVLWLFSMLIYSYSGRLTPRNAIDVEIAGLYWHFVDIVWIVIFTVVYLVEYIEL
ncbi:cytochrome c oxidase subunit 3 [Cerasicoccus maritimus]|uniref:cytochrome c oxidase subunit 3 n=1 Tax=Cerasicoccus maritimus TaxID=490089 RepID=UPI002852C6E5|nr:heme-copper oxidase subunit III [Cerasicoccus maritimus]